MVASVPGKARQAAAGVRTMGWNRARVRGALSRASRKAASGDLGAAILEAEAAVRMAPAPSSQANLARSKAADLLRQAGRHREAAEHLRRLVEAQPDMIETRRRLARTLKDAGDLKGEINAWRAVLALDGADLDAHKHLGALFTHGGHAGKATSHLRVTAEAAREDPKAWKRLALNLQETGREEEALRAWTRVVELDAGDRLARHRCIEILDGLQDLRGQTLHLWALAMDEGVNPGAWRKLCRHISGLGEPEVQLETWKELLAGTPHDLRIHSNLARLLYSLGRTAEAIGHARVLAEARPGDPEPWKALARRQRQIRDLEGEIQSWRRALQADPNLMVAHIQLDRIFEAQGRKADEIPHLVFMAGAGDPSARDRLIRHLCDLDRKPEALPHLRAAAEEAPGSASGWRHLARCLLETRDTEGALRAWRRVLGVDPTDVEAHERLDEIERRSRLGSRGGAAGSAFTITVLGNCQAYGLSQCLRALCADADVTGIIWNEVDTEERAEQIARRLEGQDLVIVQPTGKRYHGALRTDLLRPRVRRLELFPSLHFTGFHPDLISMSKQAWKRGRRHRFGTWHSALVLAAFARGLPQAEVADLFNAYVYGALGYFGEYAKAERYHLAAASELGFELKDEMDRWREDGAFVHVPNHPVIEVFWSLARMVGERLGLDMAPSGSPPPDRLARLARWPVYPEIARRLGVPGSLTFESPGGDGGAAGLEEMIDELYRAYAEADPAILGASRIQGMVETLRREGV